MSVAAGPGRIAPPLAIGIAALVVCAAPLTAQLITIRTVPVSQADQFDLFPSHTRAMGGVSIALPDTLLDPFANPATGARLAASSLFGSPSVYRVTNDAGGGRTLPLGALLRSGSWFGAGALALQQVDAALAPTPFPFLPRFDLSTRLIAPPEPQPLGDRSHGNGYVVALAGRHYPASRLSVAASATWARLAAVDGVDLLYAGSESVEQLGHALDLRLGLLKEWEGDRSLEVVALHNRFAMTHDVTFLDPTWDPGTQQVVLRPRLEHNPDRTDTWGLHLEYVRPLSAGWRLGWVATTNRMSHPKIPNYVIMNIPRDPGSSTALNLGVGLARVRDGATFGVDVLVEPIWSHTWAEAAAPTSTRLGATIPAGGRTIENRFRFSNAMVRMGLAQDLDLDASIPLAFQIGLSVHAIRYTLRQDDHVQVFRRAQRESWVEWAPTWGLSLRFPSLEVRYRGRVRYGTGRPGVVPAGGVVLAEGAARGGIVVAPSGPLTLDEVRVTSHQFSFSVPLR
jgi:hypothetical protein